MDTKPTEDVHMGKAVRSGAPGHLDTVLNQVLGEKIELDNWIFRMRVN